MPKLFLCEVWSQVKLLQVLSKPRDPKSHCKYSTYVHTALGNTVNHFHNVILGATRGVMASTSAFLAYHQCYCVGLSLAWGLNLQALVCGIF